MKCLEKKHSHVEADILAHEVGLSWWSHKTTPCWTVGLEWIYVLYAGHSKTCHMH